jgi:RNA polymerase sigma-70 factor, ECF subfamily
MDGQVTELLKRVSTGDRNALDTLMPFVYRELHKIAKGYLGRELQQHTLQPTSLIHEAYMRMVDQSHPDYSSRAHFYGVAARLMRQILVDHARARQAAKRGGGEAIPLTDSLDIASQRPIAVLELDEALHRLAEVDARKASLIEMRFFAGMTAEEIGESATIPVYTVRRELRLAQAWLHKELFK